MIKINLLNGNCQEKLKDLPDNSIDSIVTDPPYGLSFMGKKWDYDVPSTEIWQECLRVLKPGGHLLAFFGTRTYHRGVVRIEDAGFEIRDQIMWIYASGFPKSHNISKAIQKEYLCQLSKSVNLAEKLLKHSLLELREETTGFVLGNVLIPHEVDLKSLTVTGKVDDSSDLMDMFLLESTEAINLNTDTLWKSASVDNSNPLKKYITLTKLSTIIESKILSLLPKLHTLENTCGAGSALKPANEPIVVARKPLEKGLTIAENVVKWGTGAINIDGCRIETSDNFNGGAYSGEDRASKTGGKFKIVGDVGDYQQPSGRWPANIMFDEVTGCAEWSRFFYVAKASKSERNKGLEGMPLVKSGVIGTGEGGGPMLTGSGNERINLNQNFHPTVKPIKLMQYLIKLVTPPNGTVLDPFMGSGSTGVAAKQLGFGFVGCELSADYFKIASKRIDDNK